MQLSTGPKSGEGVAETGATKRTGLSFLQAKNKTISKAKMEYPKFRNIKYEIQLAMNSAMQMPPNSKNETILFWRLLQYQQHGIF